MRARPSLALTSLGYDDNIFQRTDAPPVGDYTATVSGRADALVLFGRRAFLTANGRLDYTAYARQTSQNFWNRYASGRLTVPFRRFGLYGDFALNRFKERPADRLDARTDVRENRLGGGFLLELGWRADAEIGLLRNSWAFDDPDHPEIGPSLGRTESGTRAALRYRVFGRTRLVLEASTSDVTFDDPEKWERNAAQRRFVPGVDFGTAGRLSGSVKIGRGTLDPATDDVPRYSGVVGEVSLAYRLGSGTRVLAGGKRDVRFAVFDADVYYLVRSYETRVIHYFGRTWGIEAGAALSRLGFPRTVDRIDRYRQGDVGIRLRLMENTLGRRIEYTFRVTRWDLDSTDTVIDRDQSRTVFGFGAVMGY